MTIKTFKPEYPNHLLDAILGQDSFTTDNLELIDALITRAIETKVEVKFENKTKPGSLPLEIAASLRFERGLDIR